MIRSISRLLAVVGICAGTVACETSLSRPVPGEAPALAEGPMVHRLDVSPAPPSAALLNNLKAHDFAPGTPIGAKPSVVFRRLATPELPRQPREHSPLTASFAQYLGGSGRSLGGSLAPNEGGGGSFPAVHYWSDVWPNDPTHACHIWDYIAESWTGNYPTYPPIYYIEAKAYIYMNEWHVVTQLSYANNSNHAVAYYEGTSSATISNARTIADHFFYDEGPDYPFGNAQVGYQTSIYRTCY